MRLLMLLSVFLISACSSTGAIESQESKSHKEDPYSDST